MAMKAFIFISFALGIHLLASPCWAKSSGNSQGCVKTQQKGGSTDSKEAAHNTFPRYPLDKQPSLQQAFKQISADEKQGLKAIPFSMENTEEKGVVYNYIFLGIEGDGTCLIYADDKMLV